MGILVRVDETRVKKGLLGSEVYDSEAVDMACKMVSSFQQAAHQSCVVSHSPTALAIASGELVGRRESGEPARLAVPRL